MPYAITIIYCYQHCHILLFNTHCLRRRHALTTSVYDIAIVIERTYYRHRIEYLLLLLLLVFIITIITFMFTSLLHIGFTRLPPLLIPLTLLYRLRHHLRIRYAAPEHNTYTYWRISLPRATIISSFVWLRHVNGFTPTTIRYYHCHAHQ